MPSPIAFSEGVSKQAFLKQGACECGAEPCKAWRLLLTPPDDQARSSEGGKSRAGKSGASGLMGALPLNGGERSSEPHPRSREDPHAGPRAVGRIPDACGTHPRSAVGALAVDMRYWRARSAPSRDSRPRSRSPRSWCVTTPAGCTGGTFLSSSLRRFVARTPGCQRCSCT